ncbi:anti-sigma factor family protein [Nakamurella sp.]|uniref:anti-sigma factor family protein n=1 Tax=Nakamurella sp. TaxID=1869182 RepID=UPI0037852256
MTTGGPDQEFGSRQVCQDDAAYVLGALSPADRRTYEEHLRDCAGCQASVRRLAGLPGLLALTTEDSLTGPERPVPPSVLARVLGRVTRARRRRRWAVSGLVAAAAVLMVVVVWAMVRPEPTPSAGGGGNVSTSVGSASAAPSAAPDDTVSLAQVMPGPMNATLELDDKRWGTAITVVCSYDETMRTSVPYDLAIVDVDGHESSAGSWSGVPGVTARIPVATAVPRERISAFEIRLADGRTILQGSP